MERNIKYFRSGICSVKRANIVEYKTQKTSGSYIQNLSLSFKKLEIIQPSPKNNARRIFRSSVFFSEAEEGASKKTETNLRSNTGNDVRVRCSCSCGSRAVNAGKN